MYIISATIHIQISLTETHFTHCLLLNLQEISSEITEKLESLRGSFNTDIRKEYNMIMGKLGKTANV